MDDSGILGSAFGQIGDIAKKAGQQAAKVPEEAAKDVKEQVVGEKKEEVKQQAPRKWASDEERKKFLQGLYGSSRPSPEASAGKANSQAKKADSQALIEHQSDFQKQIANKSPEEQKRLLEARRDLHKEFYYNPTFNPPKKQEERPAEKVENEKKQEMQELQDKEEKKPQPLAVQRAAQKVENIPGAG